MFADAKGHSLGILGYQFTLLQASNSWGCKLNCVKACS